VFNSPFGAPNTPWPTVDHRAAADDVIHLHWIAKFLDQPSFFGSLSPDQPVVWTLHDMHAMTGGCHFSDGCDRFTQGCGSCPQLPTVRKPTDQANDLSRQYFLAKQAAFSKVNLHIVAPSRWLLACAKSSPLLASARSFHHVPYGISLDEYYPMDRREARARLGIDPNATLVCFGAMDVSARRKGGRHLVQALSHLADLPGVEGLVFGSGELPVGEGPMPKLHHVGPVNGLLAQRAVYGAADVFVLPSLEDNLPLTGLEAMACGTAVVGFDAGGIPDYVRPGQTGLLARTGDGDDLGGRLRELVMDPDRAAEMGRQARKLIEREYAAEREAAAYESLYGDLLGNARQAKRIAA
jgi:glycosyltransferase involved in cell wall biosynthesis